MKETPKFEKRRKCQDNTPARALVVVTAKIHQFKFEPAVAFWYPMIFPFFFELEI